MKCPLCGKGMTRMEGAAEASSSEPQRRQETIFYCERHGVMNKATDLKEKADQISKRV